MNGLRELTLLGYTLKKHIRGYIVAVSPHGKQSLYAKSGELIIHWVDEIKITNEFILANKDRNTIAFTTCNNKQIEDFNYTTSNTVRGYKNILVAYKNNKRVIYNSKGKQIGNAMQNTAEFNDSTIYYYNEEDDSIYWHSNCDTYGFGTLYRNNEVIAERIGQFNFNEHYYLREAKTHEGRGFKIYSTRTNKCISEEPFYRSVSMSKCAVLKKESEQIYLVKDEKVEKIDITGLDDAQLVQDEMNNDLLVVSILGKYSIYDTNLKQVSDQYKHINTQTTHNRMVAERLDGTLTVLGTDGREYVKSREYPASQYAFKLMDYDILVEVDYDEIFIAYDELD